MPPSKPKRYFKIRHNQSLSKKTSHKKAELQLPVNMPVFSKSTLEKEKSKAEKALKSKSKRKIKFRPFVFPKIRLTPKHLLYIVSSIILIAVLTVLAWQAKQVWDFNQDTQKMMSQGDYENALKNYQLSYAKFPLWFIKNQVNHTQNLIESTANYKLGLEMFNKKDYTEAEAYFNLVSEDNFYYQQAQQKLTAINYFKIFKKAQDEITKANLEKGGGVEPVEVPERESPFDERPAEATDDATQTNPEENSQESANESETNSSWPTETKIIRPYEIQFFDCSTSDYANVNEEQVQTFYQVLDFLQYPKQLLEKAVVVFNTEVAYYTTRSVHTVKVDGENYEFPLLDPDQYQYSTSWIEDGGVFLNLDYKYKGNDLEAVLSFELVHVLEDLGKVSDAQIKEWMDLRGISSDLLIDWNKKVVNIDEWEASPREDFAECYKAILGNNKGGDLWKVKTQYGEPNDRASEWMKKFQAELQ